nr:hypothetical protein [uncultured Mediterraneibacter sp.]
MKRMKYGPFECDIMVADKYFFKSEVFCDYEKDVVAYAVELFLTRSAKFSRECTRESWQIRIAKGRKNRKHKFIYLIPSVLMDLPGEWVKLGGDLDEVGLTVKRVEILSEFPYFDSNE